jgi:hypothetical protein
MGRLAMAPDMAMLPCGTMIEFLHCGHLPERPAMASGTLSGLRQLGQANAIGMMGLVDEPRMQAVFYPASVPYSMGNRFALARMAVYGSSDSQPAPDASPSVRDDATCAGCLR